MILILTEDEWSPVND